MPIVIFIVEYFWHPSAMDHNGHKFETSLQVSFVFLIYGNEFLSLTSAVLIYFKGIMNSFIRWFWKGIMLIKVTHVFDVLNWHCITFSLFLLQVTKSKSNDSTLNCMQCVLDKILFSIFTFKLSIFMFSKLQYVKT